VGGNMFCFLFGTTTPFTPEKLASLYSDHFQFVGRWMLATVSAWEKGFLTTQDGRDLITAAFESDIGG
jgi:Alpha/beta hydrolase domain